MHGVDRFRERDFLLVLLALGLACGGRVGDESRQTEPSYGVPRDDPPSAVPPRAGTGRPESAQPPAPMLGMPSVPPQRDPPQPLPMQVPTEGIYTVQAAAENVLLANCGPCHGPQLTPAAAFGINFIGEIDKLIQAGLIVPLNSPSSRVIQVMVTGSMPPPVSGLPPVTEAEIQVVAQYIDNPRFWPSLTVPGFSDAGAPPVQPPGLDGGSAPPPLPAVDAGAAGG